MPSSRCRCRPAFSGEAISTVTSPTPPATRAWRGEPAPRCLACNTCVNEMRGGAKLGCVVNPAVGHERTFRSAAPVKGERIAVVGAGPAGLTYAWRVAMHNAVTVFERAHEAGGAFRL